MAQRTPFLDSISSFSSIQTGKYADIFWDEIWGCTKIIGINYDTVWNLPVHERKRLIIKYNESQNKEEGAADENTPPTQEMQMQNMLMQQFGH